MAKTNTNIKSYEVSELIEHLKKVKSRINVALGTKKGLDNDSDNSEIKVFSNQVFKNPVVVVSNDISLNDIIIKNNDIRDTNLCCIETADIKQIEVTCDNYDDGSKYFIINVFCKSNDLVYRLSFCSWTIDIN